MGEETMTEAIVVLVTTADVEEAERIARTALEARLAASANLVPGLRSLFWWEGKIDTSEEVLVLFKTRRDRLGQLIEAVRAQHSYQVFAAVALPILDGNADYLRWIDDSVES
jgi:periplasmic divalent cation tolerance protein